MEYLFLVEGTMVENTVFPYKTALSETNVKTNRVGVQNGPITNNRALSVTNTLKEETFVKLLNPAKNSETINLRKFILAKYYNIGYSRRLIPAK